MRLHGISAVLCFLSLGACDHQPLEIAIPPRDKPFWHLEQIQVKQAWDMIPSGSNREVVVAVIDGGFVDDHRHITNQVALNTLEGDYVDNIDQDSSGYADDYRGWNFRGCDDKAPWPCGRRDLIGDNIPHGTAVAGIVAARPVNSDADRDSVSGVCPQCRVLMIVREENVRSLTEAVRYAMRRGADVLVSSLGAGTYDSTALRNAIADAAANGRDGLGMVLIFPAGNDHKAGVQYPARDDNVIAVGAVNCRQSLWEWSPRGEVPEEIDLLAPTGPLRNQTSDCGVTTLATSGLTRTFGGTSGAAPVVAGVVGLMLLADPSLEADTIRSILFRTATRTPGDPRRIGNGIVSACRAVHAVLERAQQKPNNSCGASL